MSSLGRQGERRIITAADRRMSLCMTATTACLCVFPLARILAYSSLHSGSFEQAVRAGMKKAFLRNVFPPSIRPVGFCWPVCFVLGETPMYRATCFVQKVL